MRITKGLLSSLCLLLVSTAAAQQLQRGDNVAVCGDSITEQKIYSVFIEDYLLMCQPAAGLQAHQFGWSGESVPGLVSRMETEVIPFKPTVATTCYGMNDGGYLPIDPERQKRFREGTEMMVKNFKAAGVRLIVVGTPGVVDTDSFDKKAGKKVPAKDYNEQTLADLGNIARQVASEQGVAFADLHTPMLDAMGKLKAKYGNGYAIAGDGIHPQAAGHLVMAYAFLKALGCKGDVGTITYDARNGTATASEGHRVIAATKSGVEVESSRYPFCFTGDPASPNSTRGVLEFLPFNEELNRLLLVVKNSAAPNMTVTWGAASKTFTAAQLGKGINLAAEFPDNPFSQPFAEEEKAIRQQQEFETPGVKNILHTLPGWSVLLPEEAGR